MDTLAVANTNSLTAARTFRSVLADSSGKVPTRIEVLKAGNWPGGSVKGPLEITVTDLHEMKSNFDAGVAVPGGAGTGLPIDFSHEDWAHAAGWIVALEVVGDTLMADVDWSDAGLQALKGKSYKCISPSFYPACCGMWQDYEDPDITARNVLVGAGLTNIPFFKDLKPIMASRKSDSEDKPNVIYINASKGDSMEVTLDSVKAKKADDLNDEERTFIESNKADFSAEELTTLGFEAPAAPAETKNEIKEEENVSVPADLQPVMADIKDGKKVAVDAKVFASMQTQIAEATKVTAAYTLEKAESFVETHVARGAIKADQAGDWAKRIVADSTLKAVVEALPDNPVLADTQTKPAQAGDATRTAAIQLKEEAQKLVEAAAAKNEILDLGTAASRVLASNSELATRYNNESKVA